MKVNTSHHINFINDLKGKLVEKTHLAILIEHFDALKAGLNQSRAKERVIAAQVLTELDADVDKADLDEETSKLLHERIHDLQDAILQKSEEKLKPPIPIKLVIIFGKDHNGAMQLPIQQCISGKFPFITTASILSRSEIPEEAYIKTALRKNGIELLQKDWHIYRQVDEKHGEQFLVCLPKELRLEDLDLLPRPQSGSKLIRISAEEATNGPHEFYHFEALAPLLSGHATHDKLVAFHAHGGVGKPLGLNSKQINDLLTLLTKQRCLAAAFSSCYVGGKSTLPFLEKSPPFPIIVESIGDYPTSDSIFKSFSLTPSFSALEALMRKSGGETTSSFRKAFMQAEKKRSKEPTNQMQVYFPQSRGPAQGFRALSESAASNTLTLVKLRRAQISSQSGAITLKNTSLYTLYPTLIDATLSMIGKVPALLSTLPGTARHSIQNIEMKSAPLSAFIEAQMDFYKSSLGVDKAFFIKKLDHVRKIV